MPKDIIYNQILTFKENIVKSQNLRGSYVDCGKLILVFGNYRRLVIGGKNVDSAGHKERVCEIVSRTCEESIDIPEKAMKHYAKNDDGTEYVLVRF